MIITVNIAKSRFNMNAPEGNFLSNRTSTGFPSEITGNHKIAPECRARACRHVGTRAEVSARRRRHSSDLRAIAQGAAMASLLQCTNTQEEDFI
jgi:hypothetical protein